MLFYPDINTVMNTFQTKHVYWCDSALNQIERVKYDGTERTLLLNHSLDNPQAFTVYNKHLYWIDTYVLRLLCDMEADNITLP